MMTMIFAILAGAALGFALASAIVYYVLRKFGLTGKSVNELLFRR